MNKRSEKKDIRDIFISVILFAALALLTVIIYLHPTNNIDIRFSRFLQAADWAAFLGLTSVIFNEYMLRIFCLAGILFSVTRKHYNYAALFGISAIIEIVSYAMKFLIRRPRPTSAQITAVGDASGYSFVSSHTFEYAFFFWILTAIFLNSRSLKVSRHIRIIAASLFSIMPIIVGLGRIYGGDHWLTDVIGSFFLAGICIVLIEIFSPKLTRTTNSRADKVR